MGELTKYNAACKAIALAKSVDEVKDIRDKTVAIQIYAKQAKNRQMEIDASEIRIRAERRLGEMLKGEPKNPGTRPSKQDGGTMLEPPSTIPTIADLGIDKKLSAHSRKLAALPEPEFEHRVSAWKEKVEHGEDRVRVDMLTPTAHVSHNSGDNEWYTPSEYIEAAREVMGSIDLDPASTPEANAVVKAGRFFTAEQNGMKQEWAGSVWMNPPFASNLVGRFAEKLIASIDANTVGQAVVLVNNATETKWFQKLLTQANAICLPARRVKFWHSSKITATPLQGQAVLYFGPDVGKFHEAFNGFGAVLLNTVFYDEWL